jgi:transketolase
MTSNLDQEQKTLRRRLYEILHKSHSSHIGSCVSVVDLIDAVYTVKKPEEMFVLSCGHAGLALYTVLEKFGILKNLDMDKLHFHPDRNKADGIDVSTGSLGQGLPIALGLALADKNRKVYCVISDGECAEGSIWESLRVAGKLNLNNLIILVSVNGWGGYDPISSEELKRRFSGFGYQVIEVDGHNQLLLIENLKHTPKVPFLFFARTNVDQMPFLHGQDAHYYVMTDQDYSVVQETLK